MNDSKTKAEMEKIKFYLKEMKSKKQANEQHNTANSSFNRCKKSVIW